MMSYRLEKQLASRVSYVHRKCEVSILKSKLHSGVYVVNVLGH
jgi:hypothetical protein